MFFEGIVLRFRVLLFGFLVRYLVKNLKVRCLFLLIRLVVGGTRKLVEKILVVRFFGFWGSFTSDFRLYFVIVACV